MFWTVERLQVFTYFAAKRCREAWNARIRAFPQQDDDWLKKKAQANREDRRVRLWCERKDTAVDAMLAANAKRPLG
jgi:hypothetical protein